MHIAITPVIINGKVETSIFQLKPIIPIKKISNIRILSADNPESDNTLPGVF